MIDQREIVYEEVRLSEMTRYESLGASSDRAQTYDTIHY